MAKRTKPNLNDQLHDEFLSFGVDLMRVGEDARGQVLYQLQDLLEELETKLRTSGIAGINRTEWQLKRTNALINQIKKTISTAYRDVNAGMSSTMLGVATLQAAQAAKILTEAFDGANVLSVGFSQKELEVLASDVMIHGAPSADWWGQQSLDLQNAFTAELRKGIMAGETNDQIVNRIIGERTGNKYVVSIDGEDKILNEYDGGIMSASRRDATALVRSSVQTVSSNTLMETYKDNSDIIKGTLWTATLDTATCPYCGDLDGQSWDLDFNPLEDSDPYPGNPPAHWNCRCMPVPIVKSWEDLIAEAGGDTSDLEEIEPSTRASMDGQVPDTQSYQDWFDKQDMERQQEILGPGRYSLYKQGNLDLGDLSDQSGNTLTLDALRTKMENE